MTTRTIAIVGPTAVGKTDLSLTIAGALGGEVVNADSMQLYRGMDIGTAKVPPGERRGIAHHVIDVLDVTQTASVAEYQRAGRAAVAEIHGRGRVAVVVGGSGLFVSALLDAMEFPPQDEAVRRRLQADLEEVGAAALYQRLVDHDAAAAAAILPTNTRRIVRALEVLEVTGTMPTTRLGPLPAVVPSVRIGLRRDRQELDSRIESRVEHMWREGLVDEVRSLEARGLRAGLTASRALGYQQVLRGLAGTCSMEQAKQDTVSATRRFVRRQESWFARDTQVTWLEAGSPQLHEAALRCVNGV